MSSMNPIDDIPATFARRPLFEPIAPWLERLDVPGVPGHAALDALLTGAAPEARSGGGAPIRFVPPPANTATQSTRAPAGYEEQVFASGEVPTRSGDWHDFFNALAWCAWPRSKSACNRLHLAELRARAAAGLTGRGPRRDALTQFDECGIVVVTSDAGIAELLASHTWHEAFWQRRARLLKTTRFLVFGHGSWDQLRAPFFGLCAKALYRVVSDEWHNLDERTRLSDTDAWLAGRLCAQIQHLTPRDFSPLPLLGIPGVVPDSESEDYYLDTRQFRPKRTHAA